MLRAGNYDMSRTPVDPLPSIRRVAPGPAPGFLFCRCRFSLRRSSGIFPNRPLSTGKRKFGLRHLMNFSGSRKQSSDCGASDRALPVLRLMTSPNFGRFLDRQIGRLGAGERIIRPDQFSWGTS